MKTTFLKLLTFVICISFAISPMASDVTIPNTFSNGQVADATQVNANFSALKVGVNEKQAKHTGSVYRWISFHTYSQGFGWKMNNNAAMFGGIAPSLWTDNAASVSSMSSDKDVLRTLFTRKGYGGKNAVVLSEEWQSYSSTNGQIVLALYRIKNTSLSDITWSPSFYYTSYLGWGENASVALNGVLAWSTSGDCSPCAAPTTLALTIPANRTSTIIFGAGSSPAATTRSTVLAFTNNSLALPAGLEYVDDLDTATGGWEQ